MTDTTVQKLIINRLTKTQFAGASPSSTELWAVDPEFTGGKVLATDANGDIVESNISTTSVGTVTSVNNVSPVSGNVTLSIPSSASDIGAVAANASITSATKCKITYDSKGLVTSGADLSSGDITTALGYTPYDSSNPSGYTSNVGTVTSVNNVSPVSGNVTLSIPTDTNDLTNGAGYITSSALSGYLTTSDIVSSVDSSSTNSKAVGAKLFYDTCGDIETLINAL